MKGRDVVFRFCRDHGEGRWLPAYGVGITAATKPLNEGLKLKPGDERGPHWQKRYDSDRRCQYIRYDTNFHKSLLHRGILAPPGPGSIRLFDSGDNLFRHDVIGEHGASEYAIKTRGRGRDVTEFRLRPGRDNHHLDNMAGLLCAASVRKIPIPGTEGQHESKKKRTVVQVSGEELRNGRLRKQ